MTRRLGQTLILVNVVNAAETINEHSCPRFESYPGLDQTEDVMLTQNMRNLGH